MISFTLCLYKFLKQLFLKSKPREIIYRNFKKFNEEDCNQELRGKLFTELINNHSSFENVFIDVLNKNAPIKKTVIRANTSYVTKTLRKSIIKRSWLEKTFFKKELKNPLQNIDYTNKSKNIF